MPRSPRSTAIRAAAEALIGTNWRNWGTKTVARQVVKAMEEAGFRVIAMPSRKPQHDGSEG